MVLSSNPKQSKDPFEQPSLDPTALDLFVNDICGGDQEIIADLLETYCESSNGLLNEMQQALKSGEHEELRRAAHSMKSSCRIFGAEWLAGNCEIVEQLAFEGNVRDVPKILSTIQRQTVQLRALLREQFDFSDCAAGDE